MMHNISRFIAALALILLTAQTAGAQTVSNVPYIDADGNEQTATYATVVTSDMGGTSADNFSSGNAWYYVNSDVTLNGAYNTSTTTQNIILGDGATLTVSGLFRFQYASLNIYCQSGGTGRLVVSGSYGSNAIFSVTSGGTLTINGGTVEVTNPSSNGNGFSGNLVMNGGTATFTSNKGVTCYAITGSVTLNGGTFTATSGSWMGVCGKTVTIGDGKYFKDGSGNIYYGTLTDAQNNALNGVTLSPATKTEYIQACLGTGNDGSASKPYTISDAAGWDAFCLALQDNDTWNRFSGKTVQLGADITVTRMAGGDSHDFTGTFDGGGNTLTFTATATDNYCAPFRHVQGASAETPAVISNLNVVSTVTADDYRHPAGLIAMQSGYVSVTDCNVEAHISNTKGTANPSDLYSAALVSQSNGVLTVSGCTTTGQIATDGKFAAGLVGIVQNTATIENCRASVTIQSTTSGDGTHGGLVASQPSKTTITITGCVFDGRLLGSATNCCGGFIGYRKGAAGIYNSLFAPTEVTVQNSGSATFARNDVDTHNCYYTYYLCDGEHYVPYYATDGITRRNGHATRTVTAADDVTIEPIALTGTPTQYTVSGITAYSGGGLQLGETLYYGSGDQLSLTLSNTGAPEGYQYGYTVSAGTLSGSTLTMPDQDVTISINTAALTAIPWTGGGTEGNPYLIKYASQLDLLAHRVNGTLGETRQEDGYENTYFKLNNDISYTHTSDWNAFTSNESNYEAIGGYYDGTLRSFRGHFDGNNKTISGIRIYKGGSSRADKYQGIFGRTDSGADIHDLTLADARITGYDNTGGIVGYNNGGTVARCHVAGNVAVCAVQYNAWNHGGIVGYNNGTIEQCTSAATITTADAGSCWYYGGIAGRNEGGTLRDNLAIGATVPAAKDNTYGAITGINHGTLQRNYYAACKVADTENATGVGCNNADVNNDNNPDGAVCINTLTLAARQAPDGNYWTTYYNGALGFTIDADENACAYTATYGGSQLTLHKLGKEIPAGTAVIIVADNSVVSMTATTLPAYSGSTNDLRGVDVDTDVDDITSDLGDGTFYVLGMTTVNGEQHFGFHRYTGEEMAAHKAFVFVGNSPAQSAPSLTMVFDEATGIISVHDSGFMVNGSDAWYTLDGRRLQAKPTATGIYINNGRKVVIK